MFIDVHAHLYDKIYEGKQEDVIYRAKEYDVEKIICAGSDLETSRECIKLANKFDCVFATVGIHPEDCLNFKEEDLDVLKELAQNKKVVGIGEIGLDYYWKDVPREVQKRAFLAQIKLAYELKLPVVIHVREATGDMIDILKENQELLKYGGIIHCFNKNFEVGKIFINLGLSLSVGGVSTFPNTNKLNEAIKQLPIEKLMLETDCPYMTPVPFRGQINEPKNVVIVAEHIANVKGMDISEVKRITTENAVRMFKLGD